MNFEEALVVELKTISELNSKLYPLTTIPKKKAPYLIYETGDRQEIRTHDGYEDYGPQRCTLDILGRTYSEMKSVSALVEAKVKGFVHRKVGVTGPLIQNLEFEEYNPEIFEEQVKLFRKVIEFTVFY
jgi:hypothetical protein